jgi:scaffold Nfu/NifU family protein
MPKIAEIEPTPNPNAMKFVLKEPLTWGLSRSYENAEQAKDDKLAAASEQFIPWGREVPSSSSSRSAEPSSCAAAAARGRCGGSRTNRTDSARLPEPAVRSRTHPRASRPQRCGNVIVGPGAHLSGKQLRQRIFLAQFEVSATPGTASVTRFGCRPSAFVAHRLQTSANDLDDFNTPA